MKLNQKLAIYSVVLAVLAACSSHRSPQPVVPQQPMGTSPTVGYTHTVGDVRYTVVSYEHLPNWQGQTFVNSLNAFRRGCEKLQTQSAWQTVCRAAQQVGNRHADAKAFFERYFTPWQVAQNGQAQGLFTGYYETVLDGDLRETPQTRFPIYGIPKDFVSIPITEAQRKQGGVVRVSPTGANQGVINATGAYTANLSAFHLPAGSLALKGRFVGNQFVPYYTRDQINGGALNGIAPILGYAHDPVELFFLHVQGSGRLKLPDGRYVRFGYADKNGYPYVSIGKYMAERGYLPLSQASAQNIKAYLISHPQHLAEILGQNPSYIFFKTDTVNVNDGPIGALGVPLTAEFSGAVDRQYIQLGAPLYVSTIHPITHTALNRLIVAQDTGSAIRGAVRVDYFWGFGKEAGQMAGKMKHQGYVWQLLPNGMLPSN